jgi:hypothetical protein
MRRHYWSSPTSHPCVGILCRLRYMYLDGLVHVPSNPILVTWRVLPRPNASVAYSATSNFMQILALTLLSRISPSIFDCFVLLVDRKTLTRSSYFSRPFGGEIRKFKFPPQK